MANERDTAERFIREVLDVCRKFGFKSITFFSILDNASKDGTISVLDNLQKTIHELNVIFAPENKCVVDAYMRGYRQALNSGCDWILEIDAGYSHQPSDIPIFFNSMIEDYDCIFGSRFCAKGKITDSSGIRYVISRGGTFIANLLLGTKLSDMTSGYELFKSDILKKILGMGINSRGPFFQTEIKTYAHQYKIKEVPIHYKGASHKISRVVLLDALTNLLRLTYIRFIKK